MVASQSNISAHTPMGANLVAGGATFRIWCPKATAVYVVRQGFDIASANGWIKNGDDLLQSEARGIWSGFFPGVKDGDEYRFWVVGTGGEGFKRDPYARELVMNGYPNCNCIVREAHDYPWHDQHYKTPDFSDLQIYQLHVGVFYANDQQGNDIRNGRVSKFLDVVQRIEYLADLGINAIMPLPFSEFQGPNSRGYNGSDPFSPEMDYAVNEGELKPYLDFVNGMLAKKGFPPLSKPELVGQTNQLKAMVDLCHLYGIAVIADVVYNHAGPGFDDQSLRHINRPKHPDTTDGVYFLNAFHAGGSVFAFWEAPVRQFLIDNGKMWLEEYHMDGLRYDQVTVIDEHGGWYFCQDLSSTLRFVKPSAVQIAEYWGSERKLGVIPPPHGMGFDVGYSDHLRDTIRDALSQAAGGAGASVSMDALRDALTATDGMPNRWRTLQYIENHDLQDDDHTGRDRQPRIAALADSTNSRSWYARSRSRVAMGLLLTAPGIPALFMGQEFLEDKYWVDNPHRSDLFIYWEGLEGKDRHMSDFHRFTRDLLWLRRNYAAFRSETIEVTHVHNDNRVIAFQRWLPGVGKTVLVVVSLNETTFGNRSYPLGFPVAGHWREIFNSDIYDNYFNPESQGNYGGVDTGNDVRDGLPCTGWITVPANSILVFAQ